MKLILFDIDGTLIHSGGVGRRALERAIHQHYGVADGLSGVRLDGKTDPEIVREALLDSHPNTPNHPIEASFRGIYAAYLREELATCEDFCVLPGVVDLLQKLLDGNHSSYHLGLATGNMQEGAELKLERADLLRYFRFGGYGCDAADRTQVIRSAIRRGRAQLKIQQTIDVVIGDTPRDIEHGKRAGARVLAVATGSYTVHQLQEAGANLVLESLEPVERVLDFLAT